MKCIQILNREHQTMARIMKLVEAMGDHAAARQSIDCGDAAELLRIFSVFADASHETKEESALFPIVQSRETLYEQIRSVLFEHNQERSLIEGMRESMYANDCGEFAYYAKRLAGFLTEHFRKERLLFEKLERALTAEEDRRIVKAFEKIDAEVGSKVQEALAGLGALEAKYC